MPEFARLVSYWARHRHCSSWEAGIAIIDGSTAPPCSRRTHDNKVGRDIDNHMTRVELHGLCTCWTRAVPLPNTGLTTPMR